MQLSLDFTRLFPENESKFQREEIRQYYAKRSIALGFHGPSDIPLMNRHAAIREAGLNRIFEMIDLAADMGGEFFIFHPGRLAFYSPGRNKVIFMENRFPGKHLEFFKDSLNKILDYAAGRITVYIENTHNMPPNFLEVVSDMAQNRGLGIVWDAAFAEILPPDARARMLKFYCDNIKQVKLFHLHGITESGAHKALGPAPMNIPAYLEIINMIKADVVLEIFPEKSLLESVEYLNTLAPGLKILP